VRHTPVVFGSWLRFYPLLLAALMLGGPKVARAYCLATTIEPKKGALCSTSGIPLFWSRQCISFSVMDPGPEIATLEQAQAVADRSFGAWRNVQCNGAPLALDVQQTQMPAQCLMPQYNRHGANANSVLFIADWQQYETMSSDAFGLTLVYYNPDTGSIYDADILLNETLGALTICQGACGPGEVDIQNVLTHEAGHFFGLGHSDHPDATMAPNATIGQLSKRTLTADDRAGLCAIYGKYHQPQCNDADFIPNHGFSTLCNAPASQSSSTSSGCSVRAPRSARACNSTTAACAALGLLTTRRARRRLASAAAPAS
jgi:hypothetical protein